MINSRSTAVYQLCAIYFIVTCQYTHVILAQDNWTTTQTTSVFVGVRPASNSSFLCALTTPSSKASARSRVDCSQQCKTQRTCIGFNYVTSGPNFCQFFTYESNDLYINNGCEYYKVCYYNIIAYSCFNDLRYL